MTWCLGGVTVRKTGMSRIFVGSQMASASRIASAPQESIRPRRGNSPLGASPASAASDWEKAGGMEVQNSSQRDVHWTSNWGASVMQAGALRRRADRFQAHRQL